MRNLPLKQHSNYCFYVLRSPLCLFAQLSDNIVGKYLLNNSAADISGNEYSGTLNATTAETDRFGVAGAATGFIKELSSGTLPWRCSLLCQMISAWVTGLTQLWQPKSAFNGITAMPWLMRRFVAELQIGEPQ